MVSDQPSKPEVSKPPPGTVPVHLPGGPARLAPEQEEAVLRGNDHEGLRHNGPSERPGFQPLRCNAVRWGQRPCWSPRSGSLQGNSSSCETPPGPEPKPPVTLPHTLNADGQLATCSVQNPLAYGESLVMMITPPFLPQLLLKEIPPHPPRLPSHQMDTNHEERELFWMFKKTLQNAFELKIYFCPSFRQHRTPFHHHSPSPCPPPRAVTPSPTQSPLDRYSSQSCRFLDPFRIWEKGLSHLLGQESGAGSAY